MAEILLSSLDITASFGEKLGSLCLPDDVICLHGELGAGKTTLTQFIARGIGIDPQEYITSPTFAIFHQYRGKLKLNHMDFYRLSSSSDVVAMGLDEYFYQGGVCVIEWFQKALDIIPEDHLLIELEWIEEHSRKLRCTSKGEKWMHRIQHLFREIAD